MSGPVARTGCSSSRMKSVDIARGGSGRAWAARTIRTAIDDGVPLEQLARMLERRAAAVFGEADAHRGTDVAFALALAR
jgi:hypothetical protein